MSVIGPDLPPHLLAKRKRQQEAQGAITSQEDAGEKRRRVTTPEHGNEEVEAQSKHDDSSIGPVRPSRLSLSATSKPSKHSIGPTLPPAPLDERPPQPIASIASDSDDDDDLGPALPSADGASHDYDETVEDATAPAPISDIKPRRDDWMTMAPEQDGLAARMDPSRIRARGFNTGKSARSSGNDASSAQTWNETAEQKQKRLAQQVLGISSDQKTVPLQQASREKARKDIDTARRVRELTETSRGPSMLEKHNSGKPDVEDDPSKRAFDREKDMGNASRITGSQKREMISKASDYSSRFSKGSYL